MKLYDRVDRIHRELAAAGIGEHDPVTAADLAPFDQYHYRGLEAVEAAIAALGLDGRSRVLDVGSGIGGPARHLAASIGAEVTALDIQADLDRTARDLTRRAGLDGLVRHVCGDILAGPPAAGAYDAIVSWLVFLHIPDRTRLFAACREALVVGGGLYVEDFTLQREPSRADADDLRTKVLCPYLPTAEEYVAQVSEGGFGAIEATDLSADWARFTADRLATFRADHARQVAVLGPEIVAGLDDFYATIARLYAHGVLGGIRVVARAA